MPAGKALSSENNPSGTVAHVIPVGQASSHGLFYVSNAQAYLLLVQTLPYESLSELAGANLFHIRS